MLSYIWLGMILLGVCVGILGGKAQLIGSESLSVANSAVNLCIGLVGVMSLWLGMMRLAEKAGLIEVLARLMRPLLRRLFPQVPEDHPAMGYILMNMAANMLGLNNAATPLGIKAMQGLQSLNAYPRMATNAMCMLLAINTSSIQLLPATTIAILAANGSSNPTSIVGTALLATLCSTIAAIVAVKIAEKLPWYDHARLVARYYPQAAARQAAEDQTSTLALPQQATGEGEGEPVQSAVSLSPWGLAALCAYFGLFVFCLCAALWQSQGNMFSGFLNSLSMLALPFLLGFFPLFAALRKINVYDEFVEGAKEGLQVAFRIIPYLLAMLVAIALLRSSGVLKWFGDLCAPLFAALGFPPDLLPLALMRPLSGSGSNAIFLELIHNFGADSFVVKCAATIIGSTETTFYVIAVYFGAVAIARVRHAVVVGLFADLIGIISAICICRLVFGGA